MGAPQPAATEALRQQRDPRRVLACTDCYPRQSRAGNLAKSARNRAWECKIYISFDGETNGGLRLTV